MKSLFFIILCTICFGAKAQYKNSNLSLSIVNKDTLQVDINTAHQNIKKINYQFQNDTVIIKVKTGLIITKGKNNKIIPLPKNTHYIILNGEIFYIKYDFKYNFKYIDRKSFLEK